MLDQCFDPDSPARRAVDVVASHARGTPIDRDLRVNMHFHPDRLHCGRPILAAMACDGVYRSQFETQTSNGGLTAHPGGDRWRWESRIFGGVYDCVAPAERPKYGALNFRRTSVGASPRFGSAYLRLSEQTLHRTTFCYPDSFYEPAHFGVAAKMSLIPLAQSHQGDPLDGYIEAQVHGLVRIADAEAIVLDPCFRSSDIERIAHTLSCPVEWHAGFRVHVEVLEANPHYRGPEYVRLARALACDGWLTPREIGDAARAGGHDPQDLKRVWHCVARFGAPADAAPPP